MSTEQKQISAESLILESQNVIQQPHKALLAVINKQSEQIAELKAELEKEKPTQKREMRS